MVVAYLQWRVTLRHRIPLGIFMGLYEWQEIGQTNSTKQSALISFEKSKNYFLFTNAFNCRV